MKKNLPLVSEATNYVNLERLTFLVDGVFAITMTLLVLELRIPEANTASLSQSLLAMVPRLYIYFIAFYSIANHWVVRASKSNRGASRWALTNFTMPVV